MRDRWQLQEAKQRFSELIRSVEAEGPQVVTRHGEDVAVVISIAEYRHLRHEGKNFKAFLQSGAAAVSGRTAARAPGSR